ncbi:MAG: phosphoribosylformylglycinamidine synthase subunit PurS [Brevinematia bacterium]
MKYKVTVLLKDNVFDPQGSAILKVLHNLGYRGISDVRVGKVFYLETDDSEDTVRKVSNEVLSNPVIERFEIEKVEE